MSGEWLLCARAHLCGRGAPTLPSFSPGGVEPAGPRSGRGPAPFVLGLPLEKQLAALLLPAFIQPNPVPFCGLTSCICSFCNHSVYQVPLELQVRVELTRLKQHVSITCAQMPMGWKTHMCLTLGAASPVEVFLRGSPSPPPYP